MPQLKCHLLCCRQGKLFLRAWLAGLVTVSRLYFTRLVLFRTSSVVAERNLSHKLGCGREELSHKLVCGREELSHKLGCGREELSHKLGCGREEFILQARLWPRGIYFTSSVVAERNLFFKLGCGREEFILQARLWPRGIISQARLWPRGIISLAQLWPRGTILHARSRSRLDFRCSCISSCLFLASSPVSYVVPDSSQFRVYF